MAQSVLEQTPRTAPAPSDGFDAMLVGGAWRPGRSGWTADDLDPYTRDLPVRIPLANEDDVDEAYPAAAAAQHDRAGTRPADRSAVHRRAAELMEARREEIVDRLIRESGSTRIKAQLERGLRFASRVQAGTTHVNDSPVNDLPTFPFGGEKNSGIGRYNGRLAIEEFTTALWISVQHEPYPF